MPLSKVSERYPYLPEEDIISALEQGTAKALANIFKRSAKAAWTGNTLAMFLVGENDLTEIVPLDLTPHARRNLEWYIESELMRLNALAEVERIRIFEKKVVTGEIQNIRPSGTIDVWIHLDDGGLRVKQILATYPFKYQPVRERPRYKVGDVLPFMITSIRPISERGNSTKVLITLSRAARDFPAQMLMQRQDIKVKAISRVPGYRTLLKTYGRDTPKKKHIISVARELGEHLIFV